MKEKLKGQAAESLGDLGTCIMGSMTETPCTRPAAALWQRSPLCREHFAEAEIGDGADDLRLGLSLLGDMIWEAKGHKCDSLTNSLERVRAGLRERLEDTDGAYEIARRLADRRTSEAGNE